MITILALKDKERIGQILLTIPDAENNAQVLVMSEGGKEWGYIAVDIQSSVIRVLKMEIFGCGNLSALDNHSRLCADSLLRAAASYGATIGAYRIESQIEALREFFLGCGFIQSNHKFISPLSNFIKICHN